MRKFFIAIAAIAMAFSMMVLGSQPASAGDCTLGQCGTIIHGADAGYDDPIIVRCDYGVESSKRYIYEGQSSRSKCRDTDQVYVRYNEEIHCKTNSGAWIPFFDAQGWHKINDLFYRTCVVQRD